MRWSRHHDSAHVFQFVRLEDIATDKRPGMENVVYIADTGRGSNSAGTNPFASTNGRIWKLVLDPTDPQKVLSLSVFIEGDDHVVKTIGEIHQPDNLETTQNGLYITEDPGSSQHSRSAPPIRMRLPHGSGNTTSRPVWTLPWPS